MKLVFCGTPEFAVPSLQAVIHAGHEVALVLTQPDRPAGRKLELQVSPIKQLALSLGLPVVQPDKLKTNAELRAQLESIAPDAIIVVAYGRILPDWMLVLPTASDASTSTARCCRSIAARHRFSGPSPTERPRQALRRCASTPGWTQAIHCFRTVFPSVRTQPLHSYIHSWRNSAGNYWWRPSAASQQARSR
jgi:hypothetical protein